MQNETDKTVPKIFNFGITQLPIFEDTLGIIQTLTKSNGIITKITFLLYVNVQAPKKDDLMDLDGSTYKVTKSVSIERVDGFTTIILEVTKT